MKKIILCVIGCISVALAFVGAFLPILPTTPFLLLAMYCFVRSSDKLTEKLKHTKLYQKHLQSFSKGKGMTFGTKIKVAAMVTLTMGIGFFFMSRVPWARWLLAAVWACHIIYFFFIMPTYREDKDIDDGSNQ